MPERKFSRSASSRSILGDDSLAKSRGDLVNFLHCLRWNPAITDVDQGFHFAQSILNLMDNWKIKFRHSLKPFLKIREQIRLVQQLGAVRGKTFVNYRCQYFSSAEPAAQTNELRQLFIVHLVHCLLYAVLRAIQFPAHIIPIPLVCRPNDRLRMRCNRISHANTLRQRSDALPNVLHGFCVFRLHSNKAIRDHRSQQKSNTWTLGKIRSLVAADMC